MFLSEPAFQPAYADEWVARPGGVCEEHLNNAVVATCSAGSFNELGQVTLLVNSQTIHSISLTANIGDQINSSTSATVDPFIQISPSFADASQFSIVVSPGINNIALSTPEPSGVGMVALGLAGLAVFARRKSILKIR